MAQGCGSWTWANEKVQRALHDLCRCHNALDFQLKQGNPRFRAVLYVRSGVTSHRLFSKRHSADKRCRLRFWSGVMAHSLPASSTKNSATWWENSGVSILLDLQNHSFSNGAAARCDDNFTRSLQASNQKNHSMFE
jgi:hypothetical protein